MKTKLLKKIRKRWEIVHCNMDEPFYESLGNGITMILEKDESLAINRKNRNIDYHSYDAFSKMEGSFATYLAYVVLPICSRFIGQHKHYDYERKMKLISKLLSKKIKREVYI